MRTYQGHVQQGHDKENDEAKTWGIRRLLLSEGGWRESRPERGSSLWKNSEEGMSSTSVEMKEGCESNGVRE